MKVILSKRGQITIPVNERRELGIEGKKSESRFTNIARWIINL